MADRGVAMLNPMATWYHNNLANVANLSSGAWAATRYSVNSDQIGAGIPTLNNGLCDHYNFSRSA